jgi:hypothetical protein
MPSAASFAPFKDGIVELRQKGGSLRLIRELLATVGVAVGPDTIARFLAEMNGDPVPRRRNHRFNLLGSFVISLLGHGSILSSVVFHSQLLTMTSSFCGTMPDSEHDQGERFGDSSGGPR